MVKANPKSNPKEKAVYKTGEYIRKALSENVNVSMSAMMWARASAAIKIVADATKKAHNDKDAIILYGISDNITEQIQKSLSGEAIYEKLSMILDSHRDKDDGRK